MAKKFQLTSTEFLLAVVFAILWFVFSSKSFILFLNQLTPFAGFIFYYIIIFATLFILSKIGLVVFGIKINDIKQILGTTMIFFCFFVIFNFTSPYIQNVTGKSVEACSQIFYQSEDGFLWTFWQSLINDITTTRILMGVTIFFIVLLAGILIDRKVRFD